MKQILLITVILGFASCARLDNLYLPASQRSFSNSFGRSTNEGFSSQTYSSNNQNQVPILRFAADNDGEGTYRYNYETSNSISAEEEGDARGSGTKAHGSFSYVSPEGQHISLTYAADENGFVPQGSHIPTPPPIPEEILKSLQQNAAEEARGIFNEGSYRGEGLAEGQYNGARQSAGAFSRSSSSSGNYAFNGGYRY